MKTFHFLSVLDNHYSRDNKLIIASVMGVFSFALVIVLAFLKGKVVQIKLSSTVMTHMLLNESDAYVFIYVDVLSLCQKRNKKHPADCTHLTLTKNN